MDYANLFIYYATIYEEYIQKLILRERSGEKPSKDYFPIVEQNHVSKLYLGENINETRDVKIHAQVSKLKKGEVQNYKNEHESNFKISP